MVQNSAFCPVLVSQLRSLPQSQSRRLNLNIFFSVNTFLFHPPHPTPAARIDHFPLLCWYCFALNLVCCIYLVVLICLGPEDASVFQIVEIPVLEFTVWWGR